MVSRDDFNSKREFFESDPRAGELRQVCLRGVGALEAHIQMYGGGEAVVELLDVNVRLRDLGIVASMHVIPDDEPDAVAKQREQYEDPLRFSEYVCGQFLRTLEKASVGPEISVLAEHDGFMGKAPTFYATAPDAVPDSVKDLRVSLGMTGLIQVWLGSNEGY